MSTPRWTLAALVPLPLEGVQGMVAGLDLDVVVPEDRSPEAARLAVADADLILGDFQHTVRVDEALLAQAPHLAFVQQPTVGTEHLDLAACAARGIPVANVAGANARSVAEWCVLAAQAALRSTGWLHEQMRAGAFPQHEVVERGCRDLGGRRVGVLGFGAIGRHVARLLRGYECDVSYWSRTPRPEGETEGATYRALDELVASSEVLVVVVALTDETRDLLDRARLAALPRGAVLVNAARGGVLDEGALLDLLDEGHLSGAALDVFREEPPAAHARVRQHDRLLLSPHTAGATLDARLRMLAATTANLRRALAGEPVEDVRNGVDPLVRRRR